MAPAREGVSLQALGKLDPVAVILLAAESKLATRPYQSSRWSGGGYDASAPRLPTATERTRLHAACA